MDIERLKPSSNFGGICRSLVPDEWDALNALSPLSEEALRSISQNSDYFFLLASIDGKIVGMTLAIKLLKTDGSQWLYVDELDVHPHFRRQGIATALMHELFTHARSEGLEEVWVGAESSNDGANLFYESLNPSEISDVKGYTFNLGK